MISTNVLCNATCLTAGDRRLANVIEQRGLTMINMTHYSNHWRACLHILSIFIDCSCKRIHQCFFSNIVANNSIFMPKLFHNQYCRFLVDTLIHISHHAKLHQLTNNRISLDRQLLCQISHGNGFAKLYFMNDSLSRLHKFLFVNSLQDPVGAYAARARTVLQKFV